MKDKRISEKCAFPVGRDETSSLSSDMNSPNKHDYDVFFSNLPSPVQFNELKALLT